MGGRRRLDPAGFPLDSRLEQADVGDPMSMRPAVCEVVLELRDAYDDWELALWFAGSNEWLDHALPIEVIQRDAAAVVRAARIDRFIARG